MNKHIGSNFDDFLREEGILPMKIKDLFGLKEKEYKKGDRFAEHEHIRGYNQAINQEIEIDEEKMAEVLLLQECSMRWESINDEEKEYWLEKAQAISKALSEGKILKKKESE